MLFSFAQLMLSLSISFAGSLGLQSLTSAEVVDVDKIFREPKSVALVFQPNCHSCKEQVSDLSCLGVPVRLIGAFHHRKSLRTEYISMKTKYPAYQANKELLKAWSVTSSVTPQIFLLDEHSHVKAKLIGSRTCSELKKTLKL